jgi:predicted phosphodiesterase
MLAILSDIHGNILALDAVVADALSLGANEFVNLGDSLSGPLWPAETADYLIQKDWPTLAGNHERQLLTLSESSMNLSDQYTHSKLSGLHFDWMLGLPSTLAYKPDIFLCHGTPNSDLVYFLHDITPQGIVDAPLTTVAERSADRDEKYIFCGHTHLQKITQVNERKIVINPGSVGLPAYDEIHPFPHIIESGSSHARYALFDGENIFLRSVEYDYQGASKKAKDEGRLDWAIALSTGYME